MSNTIGSGDTRHEALETGAIGAVRTLTGSRVFVFHHHHFQLILNGISQGFESELSLRQLPKTSERESCVNGLSYTGDRSFVMGFFDCAGSAQDGF